MGIYDRLKNKETKIAVIGLGYVGLPIALEFAKTMSVIGFDINKKRVDMMKKNMDPSKELDSSAFNGCDIEFSANVEDLKAATFFVVAVPTPINSNKLPDLKPLLGASNTVASVLKKGDYVVYESTVYPGCTEGDCIPVLEEVSTLKWKEDFMIGYSPERINPGDTKHTLTNVIKVVSGCCDESLEQIAKVYEVVIEAGVHRATSIKVAEAAKIIENTQRDLNIALVNELSIIFNKMEINTFDVLEAAGTKWNFLKFYPGLVGGHCIGVDPYYLTFKAKQLGYHAQIINAGRFVNDSMGGYTAKQTVKKIIASGKHISESKVLIMGATFKEDVSDIRNSKVVDVVNELKSFGAKVEVIDPYADSSSLEEEYGFGLVKEMGKDYDAVIITVNHRAYLDFNEDYFNSITSENPIIVDIKGIYKDKIKNLTYWSL